MDKDSKILELEKTIAYLSEENARLSGEVERLNPKGKDYTTEEMDYRFDIADVRDSEVLKRMDREYREKYNKSPPKD